jgi:hypothetical protein
LLVEPIHVHDTRREHLKAREVALHIWHGRYLDSITKVVIVNRTDIHISKLVDVYLGQLIYLAHLVWLHLSKLIRHHEVLLTLILIALTLAMTSKKLIDIKLMVSL